MESSGRIGVEVFCGEKQKHTDEAPSWTAFSREKLRNMKPFPTLGTRVGRNRLGVRDLAGAGDQSGRGD